MADIDQKIGRYDFGIVIQNFALIVVFALTFYGIAFGVCVTDISDEPMETKSHSAPSNIMFVLDNSGSMDWEFMTSENSGLYSGAYYLYPDTAFINSNDRAYGDSNELNATERKEWQSQWSGYNKIFYNPNALYSPWPLKTNADTDEPFSNPHNDDPGDSKLNMDGEYFSVTPGTTTEVIVDNGDSGFSLNTPSAWTLNSTSYPDDRYEDNYYYTNTNNDAVGDWARWTPDLPAAGNYNVYAWWTSNGSRDTTVQYKVYHNLATDLPAVQDQQVNEGGWNFLGNYSFNNDGTEYVQLDPDIAGGSTYSADVIKFSYGEIPISVNNAHYFIINDLDSDGVKDSGEDIYLVNFVDRDSDGDLDDRDYYLFNDDGNDEVENGELVYKNDSAVPDGVKAGLYDEEGTFVRFSTDIEDLQNFANWFSFYRKRELTAKAAVAGSLDDLEWVYVGFYSINSGLRQTVLPIKIETNDIIIDNQDSGYTESGSWSESSASNEYNGSSRYTSGNDSVKWTPDLAAGTYKVYVWYDYWDTRDTNALYTVHHSGGDDTFRENQKVDYSQWVELGEFNFDAGTSGYVQVERDGSSTGSSTSADAVKFELTSGGGVEVDETDTLLSLLYDMDSSGSTPLRTALNNVGRYYDADDGNDGNLGSSPFADAAGGGGCQQAFSIVMTDGFWNGASPGVGNQDANTASNFDGSPYADTYDNTLADVAMKYYKNDLVDTVDDTIPTNSCDPANHQHMVTYSVSFGVTGTLTPDDYHECLLDGSTPPWPEIVEDTNTTLDDLYHASVNGRGLFFSASDPQELVDALIGVTTNIASRESSGASVSVNGDELNTGTVLYQASYISDTWIGDVTAYPVDPVTGEIKKEETDILWHASDKLQDIGWADRNIVTFDSDSGAGTQFLYANLTASQKVLLNSDSNVVDFIKGKNDISGFRTRTKKLGDIVHSAPLLVGETIYAGGNDGMLHAFDASDGKERFAFVPNLIYDNFYDEIDLQKSFFKPGYEHRFFVDLTPFARKEIDVDQDASDDTFTLLVGGLGKGGKGYYCLDITDADTKTYNSPITAIEPMVKWEYPAASDDDIGYSYSMPIIVKSNATAIEDVTKRKWVVIFGNGYDSVSGNAVLYILNVDGTLLRKIDTGAGGCNGLSTPSVVDVNFDLKADYVYAGDIKGNLWKFDLSDSDPANWEIAHENSSGDAVPLFSVPGKPITSKPDVMQHCLAGDMDTDLTCDDKTLEGYIVTFGTGKYLNANDRTSVDSQYVFGIWDYGDDDDDQEYLGTFDEAGSTQLSNLDDDIALLEQTEVYNEYHGGNYLRVLSDNQLDWTIMCDDTAGQNPDPEPHPAPPLKRNAGWYFKLPLAGECIIKDVIIRDKKLIYITFTPDSSPCSGGGNSIIHEVNACTGGRLDAAQFDITDDRLINSSDLIDVGLTDGDGNPILVSPTGIERPGMLHNPVFIRFLDKPVEMKIFSSSAGTTETTFENNEPRGMFYWRSQ